MARVTLARSAQEILQAARERRDSLLAASDWTQLPDNRLSPDERAAWAAVRAEWRAVVDDIKAGVTPRPWAAAPF
ncbi:MAG: hypothetical protein KA105_02850 [Caulobacter sp.]|nr:hypothetical protein [Caulobacter sp.]